MSDKMTFAEYNEKYPNHCPECEGTGVQTTSDSDSFWGASCSRESSEPYACLESGCPRCGCEDIFDDEAGDYKTCPNCGWNWDNSEDFRCPADPEKEALYEGNQVYEDNADLWGDMPI